MLSKEILEEIIELMKNNSCSGDLEGMECTYNGKEYTFKEVHSEGWINEGKYDQNLYVHELMEDDCRTGIFFGQGVTRWGSYYSDYEWEYEDLEQVKQVEETVVIKKWVNVKY